MHGLTNFQISQIHFNKLWQIFWQAAYISFSVYVSNHALTHFNAWGDISIDKVQWHFNVNLLGGTYALKIDVLNGVAHWVHLIIAQQHLFLFSAQIKRQDGGMESFVTE